VKVRPFEDVVTQHGATVLRVCRAVVGPIDAEDAWSETFLSALRADPDPDPAARDPDLWAALQRLPDKQRHAVAYHHLAGLPFAEIAAILGNSPAAARRAAADGIKTLRRHWKKDEKT